MQRQPICIEDAMRQLILYLGPALIFLATTGSAEMAEKDLMEHKVDVSDVTYLGRASVRTVPAIQSADEDKIAILVDSHFSNASIEGYISGNLLRRETPAKYETYADMVPGEWVGPGTEAHFADVTINSD